MARKTVEERFWEKVEKSDGCWNWTASKNGKGYGQIKVSGTMVLAHRLSWELANGPIPEGMCVLHRCDNPSCVRPSHLFLGTRADNNLDMAQKGRANPGSLHGEANGEAKLTAEQVHEIRKLYATGKHTQEALGNRFGVCRRTIGDVCLRDTWAHITDALQDKISKVSQRTSSNLTAEQVHHVRRLYATGKYTQKSLGKRFGVSKWVIGGICRCKTYADIT